MEILRYEGAGKRYGSTWALRDFTLGVEEGTITALIGPSGSGKTTALRMANRMAEPDEGVIRYDGRALRSFRPEILRRSMGYVIQSVGLFPHWTVLQNVCAVPRLLGRRPREAEARADELLSLVGLEPALYRGRRPSELSGGEAQRVGVARALAADPPLLLMDEPFGAVDPLQRAKLQASFLDIQRRLKKTVLLVTHDLDEAVRLADRVVLMRGGVVVQEDTPARLLAEPSGDFARDFVGEERSLKRLARVAASSCARPPATALAGSDAPEADGSCDGPSLYWVIDRRGRPVGLVRPGGRAKPGEKAPPVLPLGATLKEVLALMLEDGPELVGLVDDEGAIRGELGLVDIARASSQAVVTGESR